MLTGIAGPFAQQIWEAPENSPSAPQDYDMANKLHQVAGKQPRWPRGEPYPMTTSVSCSTKSIPT